jgi:hypothetical protein
VGVFQEFSIRWVSIVARGVLRSLAKRLRYDMDKMHGTLKNYLTFLSIGSTFSLLSDCEKKKLVPRKKKIMTRKTRMTRRSRIANENNLMQI